MQSVPITTNVSLNLAHDEVYSIQHYVMLSVTCQWFSAGTPVSSTNKTDNITEIWRGVLDTSCNIKFVSDFRKVSGFLRVLRFPKPIKLSATIMNITEILLKVAIKHHNPWSVKSLYWYEPIGTNHLTCRGGGLWFFYSFRMFFSDNTS
jgi:hypothetical protein